jgi:serine/threonine-protein kinase
MAEVYRGRHTRLDRAVAIKVLPAGLAGHADFRERFEREARAVAALRHANIVQVYDFGDAEGMYYMVMEYIAGSDLAQLLGEHGSLPLAQVRPLLRDVAAALDYAHAQGLVHRDVKPSNVMIQAANAAGVGQRAILTDFGIAKILAGGTAATKTGVMIGTLDYMAPEQIRAAGEVDARADVYGLGVMLFQMLTGRLPFTGENPGTVVLAHLHQPAPDPRALLPDLPAHIAQAILRALAKDPAERYQTAGTLAAELDAE